MKAVLLRRLPWLIVAVALLAALCVRQDFRVRQTAKEKLRETLSLIDYTSSRPTSEGESVDLSWLQAFPQVSSASLTTPTGTVLASYKAKSQLPAGGNSATLYQEGAYGTAVINGGLPGWEATQSDLPWLIVLSVLLWAASSRQSLKSPPSVSQILERPTTPARSRDRLQRLYQAVGDNAKDSLVILDSAANVVYANRSFYRLACLDSTRRDKVNLLSLLDDDDRSVFSESLKRTLEGQPAENVRMSLQNEFKNEVLEGSFYALQETSGETLFAVGLFRDVEKAGRVVEEQRLAQERALHSQKIEALGRLAGGVSHDFNNLLTSIVFSIENLQAQLEPNSPAHQEIEDLRIATEKATKVTRQLLLYSRKRTTEPSIVGCHSVIEGTRRLAKGILGRVPTVYELEATDDRILLDEGQLDQVLLNLLVNAKDAVSEDPHIKVQTDNQRITRDSERRLPEGEYFRLRVSDNGSGIPEEVRAKIFEPYFTTKDVGEGTGLGLSTVAAIVEKGGGHIDFQTGPQGTTFEVFLPLSAGPKSPAPVAPSVQKARPDAPRSVLLVEDEETIRRVVSVLLEQRGYLVTSSGNGQEALAILDQGIKFDVLVTDLVLPELSGPKLALRFQETQSDRPVLFMSGFPGDTLDDTEMCANSQFLAKPFSPEKFFQALEELLAGQPG